MKFETWNVILAVALAVSACIGFSVGYSVGDPDRKALERYSEELDHSVLLTPGSVVECRVKEAD